MDYNNFKTKTKIMTTQTQIRQSFWEAHPQFKDDYKVTYRQNQYCTDIRCAFVDYVDHLVENGDISEKLADRVTL